MSNFPPDWFNLDNYEVCKKFGRVQWSLAINARRKIYYDFLHYQEFPKHKLLENIKQASLSNHLALDLKRLDFVFFNDGYSFSEFSWQWGFEDRNLASAMRSCWVYPRDEEEFEIEKQFGMNASYQLDSYEVGLNEEAEDHFLDSCYLANLDFSDEQLIADFKIWLFFKRRKQKEELGISFDDFGKEISKKMKNRLYEQKILPYMDLYLFWLILGSKKPTFPEMAELLFPVELVDWNKDYSEVVRETIHLKAMKLLESPVLLV